MVLSEMVRARIKEAKASQWRLSKKRVSERRARKAY